MTFSIHGLAVARGIAIGRAVLVASSRVDVAHYFIEPQQIEQELARINQSRNAVMVEVQRIQKTVPKDAPPELSALLEVHLMLLQDEMLAEGVKHWVTERLYNAEWALTSQLEVVSRQFDDMEDAYLRERKRRSRASGGALAAPYERLAHQPASARTAQTWHMAARPVVGR